MTTNEELNRFVKSGKEAVECVRDNWTVICVCAGTAQIMKLAKELGKNET